MSDNSTRQGSHAEAFAKAKEVLVLEEESIIATAEAEALAEGLSTVTRIVTAESRIAKLKSGMPELRKEVALRDDLLMRAANIRKLTDMRRNIDVMLAEQFPWIAKTLKELVEMENLLKTHKRVVDGITISAAPPNHPLVERIKIKKAAIANIRTRSLAALDELIHFKGLEDQDALKAARFENDLWDTFKKGLKRE